MIIAKHILIGWIKSCRLTRKNIKRSCVIISTVANKAKFYVETELEVNGECKIRSGFKVKKNQKTEKRKMKGMISTIAETKKKNFGEQKQVYVKYVGDECKFFCLENNMVSRIKKFTLDPFKLFWTILMRKILQNLNWHMSEYLILFIR